MSHVELRVDAVGRGTITVDGQTISGVQAFSIESEAGNRTTLTLDLVVHETDYFGEADVHISDRARDTLLKFGWTPPGDTK